MAAMSLRLASLGWRVGLALVCSVAIGQAQTEGKAHRRSLELSEPTGQDAAITNLNQLTGHSGLRQLEDELSKSLQPFSSRGSLDGVMAPRYVPPTPIIRSRKLKEELERRQNWMYLSPDDLLPGVDDPELLKLPDGTDEQKKKSPLEQFYERLEKEQKTFKSKSRSDDDPLRPRDPLRDDPQSGEDSKLPGAIRDSAQNLKKLLDQDSTWNSGAGSGSSLGSSLSDLFGLGGDRHTLTKEDIEKHKAYMDEYRKIVDGSAPPPITSLYDPLKTATAVVPASYGDLSTLMTTPTPKLGTEPSLGTIGTVANPGLLPDPNATVLNQWNPFYNPQAKVEPPKPTQLSVPMPEAPRRRF